MKPAPRFLRPNGHWHGHTGQRQEPHHLSGFCDVGARRATAVASWQLRAARAVCCTLLRTSLHTNAKPPPSCRDIARGCLQRDSQKISVRKMLSKTHLRGKMVSIQSSTVDRAPRPSVRWRASASAAPAHKEDPLLRSERIGYASELPSYALLLGSSALKLILARAGEQRTTECMSRSRRSSG
jgi:hypothetical protein